MFSFNVSSNNTNAKLARVISPVAYGGTPWSRRALATGNGIGAVQVSSPSGVSKLNLPITNIIECNDKLVRIMADAIHSTQELKSLHASAYAREQIFTTVIGPAFVPNPALTSAQQMIEIIEKQVTENGMFMPVYNNHQWINQQVSELESWERLMPEDPRVLHPPGKFSPLMKDFMHLRAQDKIKLSRLIRQKDETCYEWAKVIGQEARRQAIFLAAQTAEYVMGQVEKRKGVFLENSEGILELLEENGIVHRKMMLELEQLVQNTPQLNSQKKRNSEMAIVEEMVVRVAEGIKMKNEMSKEADKCDLEITERALQYGITGMTERQQTEITKMQDRRGLYLKEMARSTANIVQAVTGTKLAPRADQTRTGYKIAIELPENFQNDKGKQILSNVIASLMSAPHDYYALIPFVIRMNDYDPNTAIFCKPPASDDIELDAAGNKTSHPYMGVPQEMLMEYVQQDKALYAELTVIMRGNLDLIAKLHGEWRYGMHQSKTTKVPNESGVNLVWGLMTMFRPAGAEHRIKIEETLNKMHEKFNNKSRPHEVIDEYRKYLNEAIELGIKIKWLNTGRKIVIRVNKMDSMYAPVLNKYLEDDIDLDDAALRIDKLFADITRISSTLMKTDIDEMKKEMYPKRAFHINDHYIHDTERGFHEYYDDYDYSTAYRTNDGNEEGENAYYNNHTYGYGERGSYSQIKGKGLGKNGDKGKGGKNNNNKREYKEVANLTSQFQKGSSKGGRGAYPNGRQSTRIRVKCEAKGCDQMTAVGHFCLRHYRELVTEGRITKADGSMMLFDEYKSQFKSAKGSAKRAWERGEQVEYMDAINHICRMAVEHDDDAAYVEGYESTNRTDDEGERRDEGWGEKEDYGEKHAAKRMRTVNEAEEEEIDQDMFMRRVFEVNKGKN